MKALLVYYSRTGITRRVASEIAKHLKCDVEEILDVGSRSGVLGYLRSGREAVLKKLAKIRPIRKSPSSYGIVVIGTPVWAYNVSSPVRAYIFRNKGSFKKVAFFCTMGGSGSKGAFRGIEELCGKKPVALLELKAKDVLEGKYAAKVKAFVGKL